MGKQFLDQYSLLHYSTGVAAYYWGVPFWTWVVIHVSFEGMRFINTNLTFWPGGKPNAVGETLCLPPAKFTLCLPLTLSTPRQSPRHVYPCLQNSMSTPTAMSTPSFKISKSTPPPCLPLASKSVNLVSKSECLPHFVYP